MSDTPLEPGVFRALHVDRPGDVLRVTIDHPDSELNAVDGLLHEELTALFRALQREDQARAVVLTGRGRAFSAGGDFAWVPSLDNLQKLELLRRDAKQMIWDSTSSSPSSQRSTVPRSGSALRWRCSAT